MTLEKQREMIQYCVKNKLADKRLVAAQMLGENEFVREKLKFFLRHFKGMVPAEFKKYRNLLGLVKARVERTGPDTYTMMVSRGDRFMDRFLPDRTAILALLKGDALTAGEKHILCNFSTNAESICRETVDKQEYDQNASAEEEDAIVNRLNTEPPVPPRYSKETVPEKKTLLQKLRRK